MANNNYNPDVLNCIANLSNDEIFTPPALANQVLDLLPQELFCSPDTTFLDPACKSGVFLREIVKRLDHGLADKIPNRQKRIDHILHHQVYGIALTELTTLLSRRSLYCSKRANSDHSVSYFDNEQGHIFYNEIEHTWINDKCRYCGANRKEFDRGEEAEQHAYPFIHTNNPEKIFNMKFDVIIGNPPYQLNDGGGTGSSAMPLYHKFVENALKLNPRYLCMIIPARWYAGGKGLDEFREKMLQSHQIRTMIDHANSADCFPGSVIIAGGICYFLWDRGYNGNCKVINKKQDVIISETSRSLSEFRVFVRDNTAIEIIRKVRCLSIQGLDTIVHSRNCFGVISSFIGHQKYNSGDVMLYSLNGKSYINSQDFQDKDNILHRYKVIITKAMSGGNKPSSEGNYQIVSSLSVLKPKEVCSETYLCLGDFDTLLEAENMLTYVRTKFFRFLLLQALTSINISKEKFQFVPLQDFSHPWTDEMLYKKYNLSQEEIDFIESMIRPME